ncbi:MAG: MBL fold metallo-hydrolase [Spirochaetes bacterium]|nr:MBL fold metallo-hydrolase [Spirochaetota bacterium]
MRAFLVRGSRDLLVDTGTPGSGPRLRAALARLGTGPDRLSLVVITHGHLDHFGGLREIAPSLECPVAVHRADADILRTGREPPFTPVGPLLTALMRIAPMSRAGDAARSAFAPDLLIDGPLDLAPYGVDGTVESTPGHTAGSLSLFLAGGEVIIADALRGAIGLPRAPRWPFVVEDFDENRRSVGRVLGRRPSRIWTSHGGPFDLDAARRLAGRLT